MEAKSSFRLARIQKLSGMGWSYHERLLLLEGNVLSYYSDVPKGFSGTDPAFLLLV